MFKLKIFISDVIFSFFLIGTSSIKNETREIEKKINILSENNLKKEKNLNEVQLDFYYLTSPSIMEKKISTWGKLVKKEDAEKSWAMQNKILAH